jgi:hypothetical protein
VVLASVAGSPTASPVSPPRIAAAPQFGAGLWLDLDEAGFGASGNLAGKLYSVTHRVIRHAKTVESIRVVEGRTRLKGLPS